jgi:hypothetical protein
MRFFIVILILLAILFLWYIASYKKYYTVTVELDCHHDQKNDCLEKWNMIRRYENAEEAARIMSNINKTLIYFLAKLREKYRWSKEKLDDNSWTQHRAQMVAALLYGYNPERVFETDPAFTSSTSYTIDKGQKMFVCLRDKKNPDKIIDENIIIFVLLHEMAHIANYDDWGHGPEYWSTFKFILEEAVEAGIYQPVNYKIHPVDYCGLWVDYNVLYDANIHSRM